MLVGGCIRDALMACPVKDVDIEVFGLPPHTLQQQLQSRFPLDLVGQSFGVLKIRNLPIDVALPRHESKSGSGHKAFATRSDPDMTAPDAAARRDFTVNAISLNPLTNELVDPFDGIGDLQRRTLRHVSTHFDEDPLRVLRAMQFAARFEFQVAPETLTLCRNIEPENLAPERIFEEWKKLLLQGRTPSVGLHFLKDCGWIRHYPELHALVDCPQDPQWHPEGDVWLHTLLALDAFARNRIDNPYEDLVVGLAVLTHDFGKPATTFEQDGHLRSPHHDVEGEKPARAFLARLTNQTELVEDVIRLVTTHMRPLELFATRAGDSAIRRLARTVGRIDRLARVDQADRSGRGPNARQAADLAPAPGEWLLQRAEELAVKDSKPIPILMGRHLIELGLTPGPGFRPILDAAYEAQLDGKILNLADALAFARATTHT